MPTKSFFHIKPPPLLRIAVLLLVLTVTSGWWGGCERQITTGPYIEAEDPNFRRGKELARQARNREALAAFLRVLSEQGDNAPESHLEIGILSQQHLKDPLSAIYHYKKFRELRPNSKQADFAREQIDACIKEFARTLPGGLTLDQTSQAGTTNQIIENLRRENDLLKEQLASARNSALDASRNVLPPLAVESGQSTPQNQSQAQTQLQPRTYGTDPVPVVPLTPAPPPPVYTPPAATPPAAATSTARRHVVAKGDTLYSLAQRYYGNRSRWREILAANRDQLPSESSTLRIGMELRIP